MSKPLRKKASVLRAPTKKTPGPRVINVQVQGDHLIDLSKVAKPAHSIIELVWNALDADAKRVEVSFDRNRLGGIEEIRVVDDGHGIDIADAVTAFENLGGSWKRQGDRSKKERRLLHGRHGKGRFKSYGLGEKVEWLTTVRTKDGLAKYQILGDASKPGLFEIHPPRGCRSAETGTEVTIRSLNQDLVNLAGADTIEEVTKTFALYMREYPDVVLIYDDTLIDPMTFIECVGDYPLEECPVEDGRTVEPVLTIIEWKFKVDRALYLCDKNGFVVAERPPGIQAPGFSFTAHLKDDYFRELDSRGMLVLEDFQPRLTAVLNLARERMKEYFRMRAAEGVADLVTEWKKAKVYPYEGDPSNVVEVAERQVFDVCAMSVVSYLPDFDKSDARNKRLTFGLLKGAIEESPKTLRKILHDVLELPPEKQEELASLLEKTTLEAIINASKTVTNRLEFLAGLEKVLFEELGRETLLERKHLHRLLADGNTWIFGERFNLLADDEALTTVLKKHKKALGDDVDVLEPVLREDGTAGVIDLLLSGMSSASRQEERENLVVELKRPNVTIGQAELAQIKSYAHAVASDERFRDTKTEWTFWLLGNDIDESVRREGRQPNRPKGVVYEDGSISLKVWVRSWGEIVEECRARMNFFQEQLEYKAGRDAGLKYLQAAHGKYLPKQLDGSDQTTEAAGPDTEISPNPSMSNSDHCASVQAGSISNSVRHSE